MQVDTVTFPPLNERRQVASDCPSTPLAHGSCRMASSFCCWSQRSVLSLGPPRASFHEFPGMQFVLSIFFCRIKYLKYFLTLNHFLKKHRHVYHYEIYKKPSRLLSLEHRKPPKNHLFPKNPTKCPLFGSHDNLQALTHRSHVPRKFRRFKEVSKATRAA